MADHVVYGLFRKGEPRAILYVGSIRERKLVDRLKTHQAGGCRTTAKMAAKGGIPLSDLRLHVLRHWKSGVHTNAEGRVTRLAKAFGMAEWNPHGPIPIVLGRHHTSEHKAKISAKSKGHPGHKFTEEELKRMSLSHLGKKHSAEHRAKISAAGKIRMQDPEQRARMPRIEKGSRLPKRHVLAISAGAKRRMKDPEELNKFQELARNNSPKGIHIRWHVNRGISNPRCILCTGESR